MSKALKIRKVGNSLGVTLSEQVRELGLGEGDTLYLVRTKTGFELTPFDPDFAEAVDSARETMRRYPNALKKLAE